MTSCSHKLTIRGNHEATATDVTLSGSTKELHRAVVRDLRETELMSHAVTPEELAETAAAYAASAFLLYAGDDGSARVNHVAVEVGELEGEAVLVTCRGFGRGLVSRVEAGAPLSLLWPALEADVFSLIANGIGEIADDVLTLRVTSAVLHRPAPIGDASASC